MAPVLEIDNLSTHIQLTSSVVQAIGNLSLRIEAGETLGLVGESGCGKSMTGLSIMRLLPNGGRIVEGAIRFNGKDLTTLNDREIRSIRGNDIAMIFQDSMTSLNPTKSIGDQIAEPVMLHKGANRKEAIERAKEVLSLVGIPKAAERMDDFPHQMSGGQRQRVMIAIALSCEPKLLLADEPTTALDVTIQAQILALLDGLKERLGMAILLVTHDMGVVASRADRINVMYAGRIIEQANTDELFRGMRHPYTQGLLGSIPRLDSDPRQALFSIPGIPPDLTNPPKGCRFAPRCTHAVDHCREEEPPLEGDGMHRFACWEPVNGPVTRLPQIIDESVVQEVKKEKVLSLEHLVREYPVTTGILQRKSASVKAVSDVSIELARGETFGLVGESGCGKTSLGKLTVGLEPLDEGKIEVEGKEIFKLKGGRLRKARRSVQMMFQDPFASLDPRMRVGSILAEPLAVQGVGSGKERTDRVQAMLKEVGLPPNAVERYPHEFSGGQRQRIGLARVLMLEPEIIVADEPVSALDVSIRSQVLNLMKRIQAERGMASVVISHDLAVVKYLADRIGVMYLGKLVEIGSGDDIYHNPVHHYTSALIRTIPVPDPSVERAKTEVGIKGELPSPINPPSGCRFRTRCPAAQQKCADEEPILRMFGSGHFAACHFPLEKVLASTVTNSSGEELSAYEASLESEGGAGTFGSTGTGTEAPEDLGQADAGATESQRVGAATTEGGTPQDDQP